VLAYGLAGTEAAYDGAWAEPYADDWLGATTVHTHHHRLLLLHSWTVTAQAAAVLVHVLAATGNSISEFNRERKCAKN